MELHSITSTNSGGRAQDTDVAWHASQGYLDELEAFESLIRLDDRGKATGLLPRTGYIHSHGGLFAHLFPCAGEGWEDGDDDSVWWALCTQANGGDTIPRWQTDAPLCPECRDLGRFRVKRQEPA